jgi:hypothetical protein|tara:strand:- start:2124 stop:3149 length:1026 start_codon:yes stop_codon:yes gene_type:complete
MLDTIQQAFLQLLPVRRKSTQTGWISFNAVCCTHNGETPDRKGRGGIKTNDGAVSYHCFNCGYTASFIPGRHLSFKFRKLLSWLGADDLTIRHLVISAIRLKELVAPEELEKAQVEEIKFVARQLPDGSVSLTSWMTQMIEDNTCLIPPQLSQGVEYLNNRCIDTTKYEFYFTDSKSYNYHRRIIIPYYYEGKIVGSSARALDDTVKPKYWSDHPADYVFNLDKQHKDSKFVIVVEGPFDAMSIDGVSIQGSEISDTQAELIDRLQREVVVVPDTDRAGRKLVDRAIELGWTVSYPVWQETCKDLNEAVIKYGKLFVLKSILEARETSRLKIELKKKRLYS